MTAVFLNDRCRKILNMLLSAGGYTPMPAILSATGVSKRSIYYDICKLNEWLDGCHLSELTIERGKGIVIPPEEKEKIISLLEEARDDGGYVFLPSERVKIIICFIIYSREPVYIEQLMECCEVSRNTIFGDLRVVVNQLREYGLGLEYDHKKGYLAAGDTVRKRALFFLYFGELRPLFHSGVLKFADRKEIQGYMDKLELIGRELKVDYADGTIHSLAALLPIMYQNQDEILFPGLKREEITGTREFTLIRVHFPDLDEREQIYLCLHLLGSRISVASADLFEEKSNQSVYELTKALVTEFEKLACVNFEDREELERALFVHINTSMYRYQYGIQIGSLMFEDIIREYGDLFDITRVVCKYLDQMLGIPLPDSEVAYLALHFGAHLKVSRAEDDKLRILIVCVNGISTGNMLKREIQKLLPDVETVTVAAAVNIVNAQESFDLMISTVRIKSVIPVIVVHPILTDADRLNILNHPLIGGRQNSMKAESLFETVKKYVDEKDYPALRQDILACLENHGGERQVLKPAKRNGLLAHLDLSRITIQDSPALWQDSIRQAGKCLVEKGSIEKKYLETIISQTMYYGTYMFLNNEFMLAHAKPEDGVLHTDVSLAVFRTPVPFMNGRKARIIFVLAAEDQEKHLNILKDIFRLVEDPDYSDRLAGLHTGEEILHELRKILEDTK